LAPNRVETVTVRDSQNTSVPARSRHRKILSRLLAGESSQTIRFDELCALPRWLGFVDRRRGGSHRIFFRAGVPEILNLQTRNDGTCKPYQVRQVRDVILKPGLFISIDSEATDEP
jgi:hypothetical protein